MSNRYIRVKERNRLSPAELQLLSLLAKGMVLKKAASVLGKSHRTVNCQMRSMMTITRCLNHVQLGIWALRNGYVKN